MDTPDTWLGVWLLVALLFAAAEMTSPGSFFLLPFTVGALAAAGLSMFGTPLVVEWAVFVVISCLAFMALRPLARRLNRNTDDHGIGSRRLVGQQAVITQDIPSGGELGMARVHREEWRAESLDGTPVPEGTAVRVTQVEGTRVIVVPVDMDTPPVAPPDAPPSTAT